MLVYAPLPFFEANRLLVHILVLHIQVVVRLDKYSTIN